MDDDNPLQKEYDKLTTLKEKYMFLTAEIEFKRSLLFFNAIELEKTTSLEEYQKHKQGLKEYAKLIAEFKYMRKCIELNLFTPQIYIRESKQ